MMRGGVRFAWTLVTAVLLMAGSAVIHGTSLGSAVNKQLAQARAATVQYHDVAEAVADEFTDMGVNPFEGGAHEFVNFGRVDCSLDVTQPEGLRYAESSSGLRLIGVEYAIPMACPGAPPEDFLPGAGEWEAEAGAPVWTMAVNIWSGHSIE